MKARNKIAILSAHKGADSWIKLTSYINTSGSFEVESLHDFDDSVYRKAGGKLRRLYLYYRIYISYPIKCLFYLYIYRNKFKKYLVITSPFYLPALINFFSKKPVIALFNDIYPEALINAGIIKRNSWLDNIISNIVRFGIAKSAAVVYITDGHKQHAESNLGFNSNTRVIPVGADGTVFKNITIKPLSTEDIVMLYCGTLGLMHDTQTLVQYLRTQEIPTCIKLEFRTSGMGKQDFEKEIINEKLLDKHKGKLSIGDMLPSSDWANKMSNAHVGVVLQNVGAENVVFPSKVYSILMAGQAIFAITDPSSDIGKLIAGHDCGWVIRPNDISGLTEVIQEILQPSILYHKRLNAHRLGHENYDVSKLDKKWSQILIS